MAFPTLADYQDLVALLQARHVQHHILTGAEAVNVLWGCW
jgi:hypothetical protein